MKRRLSNIIEKKGKRLARSRACQLFLFAVLLLGSMRGQASIVDTVSIFSKAMNHSFKCVVIRPDAKKRTYDAEQSGKYPVVYLLHGWSGSYSNWIMKVPEISRYADEYQIMIVCPDGAISGWYIDSPVDTTMKYETYVGKEVPAYIDSHYPTIKDRKARAITGLSMGGQGAVRLAFIHADFFGACGSMSGVMDLNVAHNKYNLVRILGDTIAMIKNWNYYSVINVVDTHPKDSLAIIIDCGIDDLFYESNHFLHEKLMKLKIPHDYIERPGKHEWPYWANAVKYQMLFFNNYFKRNKYQ